MEAILPLHKLGRSRSLLRSLWIAYPARISRRLIPYPHFKPPHKLTGTYHTIGVRFFRLSRLQTAHKAIQFTMAPTRLHAPDSGLQSILGCLSARHDSRCRPIWTAPGVNPRSAYAKTRHNALQGQNSTLTHIDTLHDTSKRLTSQFRHLPRDLNRSIPAAFVHSRVDRPTDLPPRSYLDLHSDPKQNTEHNFTEKMFSTENIFISQKSWPRERAGGRARAHT